MGRKKIYSDEDAAREGKARLQRDRREAKRKAKEGEKALYGARVKELTLIVEEKDAEIVRLNEALHANASTEAGKLTKWFRYESE